MHGSLKTRFAEIRLWLCLPVIVMLAATAMMLKRTRLTRTGRVYLCRESSETAAHATGATARRW